MKPWISDSTWKHTENRRLFKNQLHSTPELAKESELGLLYKSADSKVKERASNDKEIFYNKIASEAEATAYRNDLRRNLEPECSFDDLQQLRSDV